MWKIWLIFFFVMACKSNSHLNVSITPLSRGTVMDPSSVYFLNEYYLIENLSVRLVEMDSKDGYKLMLASEIKVTNDTDYHIKIKESYFSNGERITLEDVRKSFERAMASKNSHINLRELVDEIEIDEDVLKLKLKKKTNDFFYFLTLIDLSVLHKSQYSKGELKSEDWQNATSGAFSYFHKDNGEVFLIKNPHFKIASSNYPSSIKLISARGKDSFSDFKSGTIDVGEFNLNSYDKHISNLHKEANLEVIGNTGDMVNFLALNVDKPKFASEYNRRWILKKVIKNFIVPSKYKQVARKAFEFFTPLVKGFLKEEEIIEEVDRWNDIDINVIPTSLKDGIVISTYERAFEVTLESIMSELTSVLEIPVKIENNVNPLEFEKIINEREWEIFLGITSMDQVIVGESISLHYFSSFPMFKDVNGKIKELMNKYRHSDPGTINSTINDIALQMIKDAECVPLFYVASPFFFNKEKVDVADLDELTYFNLWKLKLIQ